MQFQVKDLEVFQAQKQYIDTVVVPLVQLNLSEHSIFSSSSEVNYLTTLSQFLEHQFKGRILLLPAITYTEASYQQNLLTLLKEDLEKLEIKHIIFLTCDARWQAFKEQFSIIWLPAIPLESMDQSMKTKILEDQIKYIMPVLTSNWSTSNSSS